MSKTMDETDLLSNLCADLVSLRRLEPGLGMLFREPKGSWVPVRELYSHAGQPDESIKENLVAAWLPSPTDPNYSILVFLDDESKWSMTADYNSTRLLGRQPQSSQASKAG
jgi:hypothetical protein